MRKTAIYLILALFPFAVACGGERTPKKADSKVVELSDQEFKKRIYDFRANPDVWSYEGDRPAVVDFYATWCGPCRAVAPIMETLADEYDGRVAIYKVDVDKAREVAAAFGIQSIPAILFIPLKGEPQMVTGARPEEFYRKAIDSMLGSGQR